MTKNKVLILITLLLSIIAVFGVLSVPTSAYVSMYQFDYSTAYYQSLPYDVYWHRTNGNTYHYNSIQNILNFDYDIYPDSNLNYSFVRTSSEYSPYSLFNPYHADVVLYENFYRFSNSTSDIGGTISVIPALLDSFDWFRLCPIVTIFDVPNSNPTIYLDAYIGYTYFDGDSLIYDEFRHTHDGGDFTYTGVGGFSSLLNLYSFELYPILSSLMPDVDIHTLYIFNLDVSVLAEYHGFGVVNYLAYGEAYRFTTFIPVNPSILPPRQDISYYVGEYMSTFGRLFSIELLPGVAIYNILSLALIIPCGISIIRRV